MTKRFKKSHMLSPSLSPNEELSAMKSSGYRRDSFDRFGSDLSVVIFSYFNTAEQLIFKELNRSASNHMFDHSLIMTMNTADMTLNKMCVIGHRMMYYLSRKEFPSNPVMDLKDHSHLVFSKSQKSLWLVANTYLGYPKIPSSVKNVFFIFSEWKSLLAEELLAMNILEVNPSINYFRSRFISESVRLENKRKDLELERC